MDRREYQKEYRKATADKRRSEGRAYRESHRDELRAYYKDYWARNKDKKAAKGRRHYQNKKAEIHAKRRQRTRENLQTKIAAVLRARLGVAVRNGQKGGSAISNLGCSVAEFKRYIELQFERGMSWENWGRDTWHIDHIRPMDEFDLSDPDQVAIACHFSNMQPLWAEHNYSKGCRSFQFPVQEEWSMSAEKCDLWAGMRIPIILVSGPVNSGKTLFGLTIDSNCRCPASEVAATTIMWDQEGSADSYEGGLNFEHKDTRAAVGAGVHMQKFPAEPDSPRWRKILLETADVNDHPSAAMFRAWYISLLKVPQGKYRVGICDTFTPIQEGLIEWVKRHPEAFGCTASQFDRASSMFMWPVLKSVLAHILATDCRLRFQTFVMNVHLKNEWAAGAKTGKQVAEGLDVLEKLATVHLELDRSPKAKGKDAPRVPAAIVKKERLVRFGATTDDDKPVLPPRIELCTPDQIRKYIVSPPDFAKLDAAERMPDQSLSDDAKLLIQQEISRNNVEDSTARLSALEMARAAAAQGQAMAAAQQAQHAQDAAPTTAQQAVAPVATVAAPSERPKIMSTARQQAEIVGMMKQLFSSGKAAQEWLLEHAATNSPSELTDGEADGVLSALLKIKFELEKPKAPAPAATEDAQTDGRATKAQRDRIRELTIQVYPASAEANQAGWLATLGYQSAGSLNPLQAAERIMDLERIACPKHTPDDGLPF